MRARDMKPGCWYIAQVSYHYYLVRRSRCTGIIETYARRSLSYYGSMPWYLIEDTIHPGKLGPCEALLHSTGDAILRECSKPTV